MTEYAAEADLTEQQQSLVEQPDDDEATVDSEPRPDAVEEADYAEQTRDAGDPEDGYDY